MSHPRPQKPLLALATLSVVTLPAALAGAHFVLEAPAAMTQQNVLGDPQKAPPCGDDGSATATGERESYVEGSTISITINETIYHPGHYRVALAVNDPSELPEPPPVTEGSTPCGSAPIDEDPSFPVLADGILQHDRRLDGPQTFEVELPDGVTCENCTLQIIQFMSEHGLNDPGGCYYHHCANIEITPAGEPGDGDDGSGDGDLDGGTSPGDDGDSSPDPSDEDGDGDGEGGDGDGSSSGDDGDGDSASESSSSGGCSIAQTSTGSGVMLGLGLLAMLVRRARRSRQSAR
jgi:MYXO-CTERM domain-containing protein